MSGFHNSGTALQFNFRVSHASWITKRFSLSSWQKMCCAYFSLRTLGQGNHQPQRRFVSPLPHSVTEEPDTNIRNLTREYLNTMNLGSTPFCDGSYKFTDITEFKPTQCFYEEAHGDSHAQKGQGQLKGMHRKTVVKHRSREPLPGAKHCSPGHLMHFWLPTWIRVTWIFVRAG